ncbi:MAG: TonB-dependent receptor [Gemmatimonadota bacterium]
MRHFLVKLTAALFLWPLLALAGTAGSLEGYITDGDTGQPLPGANVLLPETRQGAATDERGFYKIHNVRAGPYRAQVSLIGYRTVTSSAILILPDRRSEWSTQLEASPIEMRAIEVVPDDPLIQTDITGTAYQIDATGLANLPVTTFQEVLSLQPATTVEGNVRGGKARETIYLVDGLPVQDVIEGGPGTELPLSAVSQMTVQTGGFDAEYGDALSGVINVITRSGGDDHRLHLRAAGDDLFGGTEVSKRRELELAASGPVRKPSLSYFTANQLVLTDTQWWQDLQHFFDSPVSHELNGLAKVDYLASPSGRLTGELLYSLRSWRDYEFSWRYNLDGLAPRQRDSYRAALLWTHTLSSHAYYSLSLSHFALHSRIGDGGVGEMDLTPYDYDFYLLYVTSGSRSWWADHRQRAYTLKADFTDQLHPDHVLKVGLEAKQYDIDAGIVRLEPQTTYFGKPLVHQPLLNYSTRYRYLPRSGSAYLQDRIEGGDRSVISFGVRLDFLDPRARRPAVELVPTAPGQYSEEVTGSVPASVKYHLSPRLGCSFPLAERSFFFVNYGHYVQYPLFEYLYSGLDNVALRGGVNVLRGNPDLLAERTRAWEISVRQELSGGILVAAAYFHKETRDQIDSKTFVPTNSRIAGDYGFSEYVNYASATASGFEFTVSRPQGRWVQGSLSYALTRAEGLSDHEDQGLNLAQWGFPVASVPFPLSWDQRHTVKADLGVELPLGVSGEVLWHYHTGRPYTYFPSADGFTPEDPGRPFQPNNRRMSSYRMLSLKLSRGIRVRSWGELTAYVDCRNALDEMNVRWVDASGRPGGELSDPSAYYTPRRTMVGVRAEL